MSRHDGKNFQAYTVTNPSDPEKKSGGGSVNHQISLTKEQLEQIYKLLAPLKPMNSS